MAKQTRSDVEVRRAKLLIAGEWVTGQETHDVLDKFTGEKIAEVEVGSREQVEAAVAAAHRSFQTNPLDPQQRYQILMRAAELIEARREEIANTIIAEAGFPLADANNEVSRAVQVFIVSAEEGKRITGTGVPIESAPGHAHRMAFTIRVPRGVVCGITSFNSPLNMVAHKVAPALAAGNTVVIKPPEVAPLSAVILFEILLAAGLPPAHANLVLGPGARLGEWLAQDPRIAFYTFTGSTSVGKYLRQSIGMRPCAMELGSIASTIVAEDADLERAAPRVANSGFRRAGQACTSTQRLYVHEEVHPRFVELLLEATRKMPVGNPHDPATLVGPMISEAEARRAQHWVQEAVEQGARILYGGKREGPLLHPTILSGVTPQMRVMCEEIFAPVLSVIPYRSLENVIEQVNAIPFGLATGLFTRDLNRAFSAARRLHVGIVHLNEPSSSRVDLMPFAGVKDSGLGREGPKYAIEEMTEERLITLSIS
jgi:acyl-CoA reductase-like NAD-dependent aldehyde dehydrogenase